MLESSNSIASNFLPPSCLRENEVKVNRIESFPHSCWKGNPHSNTLRKTVNAVGLNFNKAFFRVL